jgi:hypothetical protein
VWWQLHIWRESSQRDRARTRFPDDAELAGEVDRRLAAADVELVHRGEIVWLEPVWILARR